jgi:hypothetical protein
MGRLQICDDHGFFFDDGGMQLLNGGGRRRLLVTWGCTRSRFFNVISIFFKGLCARWREQLSMYPPCPYLYLYAYVYVFLIQ